MAVEVNQRMNIYASMYALIRLHWGRMAVAMVCMLGVAACTAASAYLIKPVLDDIFINKKVDMLKILPLLVLLIFLVKGLCSWGQGYLMSHVGNKIVVDLRQQLYDHLQGFLSPFSTGPRRGS